MSSSASGKRIQHSGRHRGSYNLDHRFAEECSNVLRRAEDKRAVRDEAAQDEAAQPPDADGRDRLFGAVAAAVAG
jgi:hypothetical protein